MQPESLISILSSGTRGELCSLLPLRSEHTDFVVSWRNNPKNSQWFVGSAVFTAAGHETWLVRQIASGRDFNWIIVTLGGRPIGTVALYDIDPTCGRAEFGRFLIGEADALGKGFGREALGLVIQLAKQARLREIYLFVKLENLRGIYLYQKAGFKCVSKANHLAKMVLELVPGPDPHEVNSPELPV